MIKSLIQEIRKPWTYEAIVHPYFKKWKIGKSFFERTWLNVFSLVWAIVPILAFSSYLFGWGLELTDDFKKTYEKFLEVTTPTQASIVGIIIPIIFALVEQLFKSQDTFFKAFLYWSKVVQLTLSSLLLVLLLTLQIILPFKITFLSASLALIWFSLNLWGTTRLILISVSFFFPKRRFSLISDYVRQIILPFEIRSNLRTAIKQHHQKNDLIFNGFFQNLCDEIKFKRPEYPKTEEILHHLSLPVMESIKNSAHEEFRNNLSYLIDIHALLVVQSSVSDGSDNYATLNTDAFWGMRQFMNWNDPYRNIISECVSRIEKDDKFFTTCAHYCIIGLYNRIVQNAPAKITGNAIEWGTMVHYLLMNHIYKIALHSNASLENSNENPLPAYINRIYLSAVKTYIGTWESLEQSIALSIKKKDIKLNKDRLLDLETHLRETAYSICRSVSNADRVSGAWLIDSLLRWNDDLPRLGQQGWRMDFREETVQNFNDVINGGDLEGEEEKHNAVLCIYNLWFDTVLTLYGLLWGYAETSNSEFPKAIAVLIYNQTLIDDSSRTDTLYGKLSSNKHILHSFIRFMSDTEYESRVTEKLGRGFRNPFDGDKISGRVYVGGGGNYLYETFANLICLNVRREKVSQSNYPYYINEIFSGILIDGESVSQIIRSLAQLVNVIRGLTPEKIQSIYAYNKQESISRYKAKYIRKTCTILIVSLQKEIERRYNQNVQDAPISKNVLEAVRVAAEDIVFTNIEKKFPISLFSECAYTHPYHASVLSKIVDLPVYTVGKELFLSPNKKFKAAPSNTIAAFSHHCEQRATHWPLNLALRSLERVEYNPDTPEKFWNNLKSATNEIRSGGNTPIILDGSRYLEFMYHWEHKTSRAVHAPVDFEHNFNEEYKNLYGESYKKHLYGVPVFSRYVEKENHYLIVGKELLRKVLFRKYANNSVLHIDFKPLEDRPYEGGIIYKWEYEVEVANGKAYYINFEKLNSDDD